MNKLNTKDLAIIPVCSVIIALGSWISIPSAVPFTLQTLCVFLVLDLIGGKKGTISILLYILLGAIGIPIFSGFSGGLGIITGLTGGYILGFLFSGFIFWLITRIFGKGLISSSIGMITGLIICYLFGTIWFINVYAKHTGPIGIMTALSMCVFPFIIPDLAKIVIAKLLSIRLKKPLANILK